VELISVFRKLKASFFERKELDFLLQNPPAPTANLRERIDWLEDLIQWIRSKGLIKHEMDFSSGTPQAARVRYLLLVLDRHPEWKEKVAITLRTILRDTRGLELFIETGLSQQDSFLGEFFKRLNEQILPQPPRTQELAFFLHRNFREPRDAEWIRLLDPKTFQRVVDLFHFGEEKETEVWNFLRKEIQTALTLLSFQVKGMSLSPFIRRRLERFQIQELPFYELPDLIEQFIYEPDPDLRRVLSDKVDKKIEACFLALYEVHQHMDEFGVSVQIVFQIERMEMMLSRMRDLNLLLRNETVDPNSLSAFVETLISQNAESRSLRSLFSENFSLLSRKIAERTAETGEHYITRNTSEYFGMMRSAFGGGFFTSFTTLIKFIITSFGLNSFFTGILASLNYSVSFLAIHFAHFTLGTKQPAATAPALAAKMHAIRNPEALQKLVDEILDIIRSQVAAVLGNVIGVMPFTILVAWLWEHWMNRTLLSQTKALHVLEDFSILGPTPLYAAFTGVLLWVSSVFSGWVDNWFAYNQLGSALSHNRRLAFVLGEVRARSLALFMKKNISGIAASISLGVILGLTQPVLQFFGIPLDVRHVTLSSGSAALAFMSLPMDRFPVTEFWLAVGGIASMGVLNISVAFSLALAVAIRARKIMAPERNLLYRAVLHRLLNQPLSLFWPRKETKAP
jgi:site-specific recombinase